MTKGSKYFLNFKWNSSVFSSISSAILYNISSSNCGSCPTTTTDTNVNCTNVPTAGECMFVLQTLVCGRSIGNTSHRFVLKTAESMRDPALLPALSTSVMVFMVAVIAGVILLIWFLYRRPCKTSGGLSQ